MSSGIMPQFVRRNTTVEPFNPESFAIVHVGSMKEA
jgi:hypothetical protein